MLFHQPKDEEMLRECDEYISRLRLSIDMRIEKMKRINKTISSDQIWTLISHSLETFSLLDVKLFSKFLNLMCLLELLIIDKNKQ